MCTANVIFRAKALFASKEKKMSEVSDILTLFPVETRHASSLQIIRFYPEALENH